MIDIQPANIITGLFAAVGAFAYCLYYFGKAYQATLQTPEKEVFRPVKALMTVGPSIVLGFMAGYAMNPDLVQLIPVVVAGWGAADIGAAIGINSYFDVK